MGKLNLTALRVRRRALADLESNRHKFPPVWIDVVTDVLPAQILTRQRPIQHVETQIRTKTIAEGRVEEVTLLPKRRKPKSTKPSKLFSPVELKYEEDHLRKQFFQDHPWELARPRTLLENNGNQHKHSNYSKGIAQPHLKLSAESAIQRQLHLLQTVPDITTEQAYDLARREFYALRRAEAVKKRIAREEAMHMGATPERGVLEWGMEVEDNAYNDWERYAENQIIESMQRGGGLTDPAAALPVNTNAGPIKDETAGSRSGPFAVQNARNESYNKAPAMR